MPPASRIGDNHVCPANEPGPKPHEGGPISSGEATVMIGGMPAATVGSTAVCKGPVDTVIKGSGTVYIKGKPAIRIGDACAHGGKVVVGFPQVMIGG